MMLNENANITVFLSLFRTPDSNRTPEAAGFSKI